MSRGLSSAEVTPAESPLTPSVLVDDWPRAADVRGAFVAGIKIARGKATLRPAAHWEVYGGSSDPDRWRYRWSTRMPRRAGSRSRSPCRPPTWCTSASESVSTQPWVGRSPLRLAGLSADLLARLTLRTGEEAGARSGSLLAVPGGFSDASLTALKNDLRSIRGDVAVDRDDQGRRARDGAGERLGAAAFRTCDTRPTMSSCYRWQAVTCCRPSAARARIVRRLVKARPPERRTDSRCTAGCSRPQCSSRLRCRPS